MSDPYNILGVNRNASDDEIKTAYRTLAKKYHPDRFDKDPAMAELASEKMQEINEAYDTIMNERKNGTARGSSSSYTGYSDASGYSDVRSFIRTGRISDADQILSGVPLDRRDAEWYYLKGTILYNRGWLEEAYNHYQRACQMDPNNMEFRTAMNQVTGQRGGVYGGGYNTNPNMAGGCSGCDVCSSLICADCCCECMGGDLIRCC